MPSGRTVRTLKKRKAFLLALDEQKGNVSKACEAVGISRRAAYEWRDDDPSFATEWEAIFEAHTDALEKEAYRRAHEGYEKPVYQGGHEVGTVTEYSDTLLIFLLKARKPGMYRDRLELNVDLSKLTDEQLLALASGKGGG